jgi:hypothetical protein
MEVDLGQFKVAKVNSKLKLFERYNFVLNIINIKKCGSAMEENLKPKMKVKGSNLHSCNLKYLSHLT